MGRHCFFGNGFEYKFWVGIQDSGFTFLESAGVKECVLRNYDLRLWAENDGEHLFCYANCDKEIRNPRNMIRVKDCLFCDVECLNNFTGVFIDNAEDDIEYRERKYHFAVWAETYAGGETITEDDLEELDGFNCDWNEFLEEALCEQNVTFDLNVDREKLLEHIKNYCYEIPKFDNYLCDTDGTDKMYRDILKNQEHTSEYANFCLACIVYHMSSYDDTICGEYET
jgi:hypothetical protein